MSYIYQADTYCDACGSEIRRDIGEPTTPGPYDSDDWPVHVGDVGEIDGPDHCASGPDCCGERVDLRAWGLKDSDTLYGIEGPVIGDLIGDELTAHGADYLREMLDEPDPTPYQRALHSFWRAAFAEYLED